LSFSPNKTYNWILRIGVQECPGMMPWKVSYVGFSWIAGIPSFSIEVQ
jgi:hypothetical protein